MRDRERKKVKNNRHHKNREEDREGKNVYGNSSRRLVTLNHDNYRTYIKSNTFLVNI